MKHKGLQQWHLSLKTKSPTHLADFLHDDVVFYSPVVFTPQRGKQITMGYLAAASQSLGKDFKYIKEVITEKLVMLEFETIIDGKYVNGIDIMTFDDDSKCTEFKVMIRPLQAVHAIQQSMMEILELMKSGR